MNEYLIYINIQRVNIQAAFKSDDIQENKNEPKKFGYLDDLKFLSKMTLEKEERYQPNIIYYEGEKVCFFPIIRIFLNMVTKNLFI